MCIHNSSVEICRVCQRPRETVYWKETDVERVKKYQGTMEINIGYTKEEERKVL